MDLGYIINFLYEFAYLLSIFIFFLLFVIFRGRQATINVTVGLYFTLLITEHFPSYDRIFLSLQTAQSQAIAKLVFFVFLTFLTTTFCYRIMPSEYREHRFESIGKKILLALGSTILVIAYSFQVLPVSEILSQSTPLQSVFGPEPYFFWWLLVPMVIMFIV